jgi:H+/Cl- antiporter ClcA
VDFVLLAILFSRLVVIFQAMLIHMWLFFQAMLIYYFAVYVYPFPATINDPQVEGATYDDGQCLGWFIAIGPVVLGFIVGAFHAVYSEKGSFKEVRIHVT